MDVHFLTQASPSMRGDVEDAVSALPRLRQFAYHTEQQTVLGRGKHVRRAYAGLHYSIGPGMHHHDDPRAGGSVGTHDVLPQARVREARKRTRLSPHLRSVNAGIRSPSPASATSSAWPATPRMYEIRRGNLPATELAVQHESEGELRRHCKSA